jgi:tRNA A37 threonylcarbamoyladenosine dehydratase
MDRLYRTRLLFGDNGVNKLQNATVMVVGCGAVGSFAVEALARTGVGHLILIDFDNVEESNINRQIFALNSTIGKQKVNVAAQRIQDINPDIQVDIFNMFLDANNTPDCNPDIIIDAIDTVSSKIAIAELCYNEGINVISSMGAGNKLNPCAFKVSDIHKTTACPLAKAVRTELKKRGVKKLKVVYSDEIPVVPAQIDETGKRVPSSIAFIPSVAGLIIASEVIKDLIK